MTKIKRQEGFTLMEVLIVTFLFSVLLLGMMNIFDWHQKVFLLEQAEVQATGSVRTALNELTKYVAQGNAIVANRTIAGQTYNSGSGALILQIPSINSSDNIIPNTFDYITYYVNGSELFQVVELGSGSVRVGNTRKLSSTIETLTFGYNNADPTQASIVTVDIVARANARGSSTVAVHVADTIFLRNR